MDKAKNDKLFWKCLTTLKVKVFRKISVGLLVKVLNYRHFVAFILYERDNNLAINCTGKLGIFSSCKIGLLLYFKTFAYWLYIYIVCIWIYLSGLLYSALSHSAFAIGAVAYCKHHRSRSDWVNTIYIMFCTLCNSLLPCVHAEYSVPSHYGHSDYRISPLWEL